jgi:nucleotide-binding universal stress UspA family protein
MFTVVVGIDTDADRAIAQAKHVAEIPCATEEVKAILLHDFGENRQGGTVEQVGAVKRAREILDDAGVEYELEGSSGEPSEAIIRMADRHDADRIVLAGRKRTPTGKVLFGSVTQAVILNTDRPVLVCSPNSDD